MAMTLYLQTSFKVTAYLMIKGTLWVKRIYEPVWTKGRVDMI